MTATSKHHRQRPHRRPFPSCQADHDEDRGSSCARRRAPADRPDPPQRPADHARRTGSHRRPARRRPRARGRRVDRGRRHRTRDDRTRHVRSHGCRHDGRHAPMTSWTPPTVAARAAAAAADLDEVAASADLVRVYLNEIGKVALLSAADEVELSKRIEAGLYAEHLLSAHNSFTAGTQARHAPGRGRRRARQGPPAAGEPAPGRLAGQALHRSRHAVPGSDPGGQPGPDPRGREVRLHQGLQVLDLRHLVDPAGDQPRDGRPVAHHPAARPPGRAGQQDAAGASRAEPDAGPRGHPRRDRPRARPHRGAHPRADRPLARPGEPRPDRRRRRRRLARRLHRRPAHAAARPRTRSRRS